LELENEETRQQRSKELAACFGRKRLGDESMGNLRKLSAVVLAGFLVGLLPGCSRDPQALKKKYLESVSRYFE
jgi:hypothetical protein